MEKVISVLFSLVVFGFFIWALVLFFTDKRRKYYLSYGFGMVFIFLLMETLLLILMQNLLHSLSFLIVFIDIVSALRILAFSVVGMIMTSRLGIACIPVTRQLFSRSRRVQITDYREYLLALFLSLLGTVLFTFILFKITHPSLSEFAVSIFGQPSRDEMASDLSFTTVFALIEIAFVEEVIFRLGIQNILGSYIKHKHGYTIAIVATSLLWASGHIMSLDPSWVKLVQIFPVGIVLGFLYRRYGLEICVLVHALFNVILTALAPHLLV